MARPSEHDWLQTITQELYSAVLCDVLDKMGHRHQALGSGFYPATSAKRLTGRAFPVLAAESYTMPERPYNRLIDALDSINVHEVFITNPLSDRAAFWGELLSNACQARGGAGAVVDGLVRDVERIEDIGFPVFAKGSRPVDSLGRSEVLDYGVSVVCGGVRVNPGDLIVADRDGVVVVPCAVEEEVVEEALHKVRGENQVREGIRRGESLRRLFDQYGVL